MGAVTYNVLKDWDLETIIEQLEAADSKPSNCEPDTSMVWSPISPAERERVKERFQSSKVRLLSFGSTCEFHSPDDAVRRQNVDTGKRWIELAHDTGAWGVKVRPNGLPKDVPTETTVGRIGGVPPRTGRLRRRPRRRDLDGSTWPATQEPPVSAAIMKATQSRFGRTMLEFEPDRHRERQREAEASTCCGHG